MTKKDTKLVLQAFDELSDLLTDMMQDYWEDTFVWDGMNYARASVLSGKETLRNLFNRLLLEGD